MISHESRDDYDCATSSSSSVLSPICYDRQLEECLQKFEDAARRESFHLLNAAYYTDAYRIECGLSPARTFSSVITLSEPTKIGKISFNEFEWFTFVNVLHEKMCDFFNDPTVSGDVVTFPCGDFIEVSQMIGFTNTDGDIGKVLKILKHSVSFYLTENDVHQIVHIDLHLIRPRLVILNDLQFCAYYYNLINVLNSWCIANNVNRKALLELYSLVYDKLFTGNMLLSSALKEYLYYYHEKVVQDFCGK